MKKLILFTAVSIFTVVSVQAQYIVKWEKYNLQYESPVEVLRYQTESDAVFGYDALSLAIDIEVFPYKEYAQEHIKDPELGAFTVAGWMGFKDVKSGGKLPNIKNGFYVTGTSADIDGTIYPTAIIVIVDKEKSFVYEATVDCYDGKIDHAIKIVNSFRYTD